MYKRKNYDIHCGKSAPIGPQIETTKTTKSGPASDYHDGSRFYDSKSKSNRVLILWGLVIFFVRHPRPNTASVRFERQLACVYANGVLQSYIFTIS